MSRRETRADVVEETDPLVPPDRDVDPAVSVVMPTMNEAAGVAECIERAKAALAEMGVTGEIIVSDSSEDRTPEIAREHGAVVVEPDQPGYGYAYQYAFEFARGEYVVIGDADTTYDFREIPRLVDRLVEADADIVMGSRLAGEIEPGAMPPLHQYVGNPLLTWFLNAFYDSGVSDAHSGLRVLTREAIEELDLDSRGMEFASEMLMAASAADLEVVEVPITYHEREGEATLESFRDGWRHVRFMLCNAPSYLFTVPGTLLAVAGLAVMVVAATGVSVGGASLGIHSMIAGSLATVVGVQTVALAVFAAFAADPIRSPRGPLIRLIERHFTLGYGVLAGLALSVAGGGYAVFLAWQWVASGFAAQPLLTADVAAFTAVLLGLQVVFDAFFLWIVRE